MISPVSETVLKLIICDRSAAFLKNFLPSNQLSSGGIYRFFTHAVDKACLYQTYLARLFISSICHFKKHSSIVRLLYFLSAERES